MATKVDIWMPLYIADYLSATSRLTTEQHGAYLLLLMDYWKSGAPPDNDAVLAQITKLSPDAWANARTMLEPFFEVQDGAWFQSRVENEMIKANHNKKANKERGLKGAQARWGNKNAPSIVQAYSEQCSAHSTSPSPTPTHISINTKKKATDVAAPEGVSQEVWDSFVKQRKAKRAQVTQLVIDGIAKEAAEAGWTLEAALQEVVVRNWQSFKADWVAEKQSEAQRRQNVMSQLTRGLSTPKAAQPFWSKTTVLEEIPNVEPKRLL